MCVCACVCACVRVCVRACVRVCVCVCVCFLCNDKKKDGSLSVLGKHITTSATPAHC